MKIHFDTTHERDRHTNRQTLHDGIGRAYASHRAAIKRYIISLVVLFTDTHGFILVNQITCYCSFVNRCFIGRLLIKSTSYLLVANYRNIYQQHLGNSIYHTCNCYVRIKFLLF